MAEIPDLSQLKNGQQAPADPAPPTQARTAFLVIVGVNGDINVVGNLDTEVAIERTITPDDIYSACTLIIKDVQVQQTAALVQAGLLQMGSMMQQQAQTDQIRNRLNLK